MVLRALGLGDFLTAVPALRALADAFPGHWRVLATPAAIEPLARLSGTVDEVADSPPLRPLSPSLGGADVAVNLHGRGPQSHRVLLAGRPHRLIAFANPRVAVDGPRWSADEHEVRRWCRLLQECGIPADPARLDLPPPPAPAPGIEGATVVHAGAASGARRWPAERWAEVARELAGRGHTVVLTGSPGERPRAEAIARRAGLPATAVLAGATDVLGLAAVVAHADLVLCGDTGVAHLATAFATPSVVLFGPVPPSEWGPPADRPQHVALWAGQRGDPHAAEADSGLLRITVDDVLGGAAAGAAAAAQARPKASTMRST